MLPLHLLGEWVSWGSVWSLLCHTSEPSTHGKYSEIHCLSVVHLLRWWQCPALFSLHTAPRTSSLHTSDNCSPCVLALRFPEHSHFTRLFCLFQIKLIVKWELVDDQDQMLFCWKIPVQITS